MKNQTVARKCFWKFRKIRRKTSVLEFLFSIKLRTGGLQLYEEETPVQGISCEFCGILKNNSFKENLQTTVSWNDPGKSLAFCGNYLQNYLFQTDASIIRSFVMCTHSTLATFLRKILLKVLASQSDCYLAGYHIFLK